MTLKIYSGDCYQGDAGIDCNANDANGTPIHTGDLIIPESGFYVGMDAEYWVVNDRMSCVIKPNSEEPAFVMGWKKAGFNSPHVRFIIIKKFYELVDGEHFKAFRFNFRRG